MSISETYLHWVQPDRSYHHQVHKQMFLWNTTIVSQSFNLNTWRKITEINSVHINASNQFLLLVLCLSGFKRPTSPLLSLLGLFPGFPYTPISLQNNNYKYIYFSPNIKIYNSKTNSLKQQTVVGVTNKDLFANKHLLMRICGIMLGL